MTSKRRFNVHVTDAVFHNCSSGAILASHIIRRSKKGAGEEKFVFVTGMQWVYGNHINFSDSLVTRNLITDLRLLGDMEEGSQSQTA